jgi:hypothetical protein
MVRPVILSALAVSPLSSAVTLTRTDGRIHIKPFSDFYYGSDAPKPYPHPLRAASGKIATRRFPMENVPGESATDKRHRGVWLSFKGVNGFNFWENEFSYNGKNAGRVTMCRIEQVKSGESAACAASRMCGVNGLVDGRGVEGLGAGSGAERLYVVTAACKAGAPGAASIQSSRFIRSLPSARLFTVRNFPGRRRG